MIKLININTKIKNKLKKYKLNLNQINYLIRK